MNDPTTADIRQVDERRKAPLVDTAIPRTGGVSTDGAGVSAVANQQGGEGVASGMASGCCETCKREGCWCSAGCREWATWGRDI